jgi:hypothetical protein
MPPQITETQPPDGYTLEPRRTSQPRADERAILRDPDGNVLAVVERWVPDHDGVN